MELSRRNFVRTAMAAGAGTLLLPNAVLAADKVLAEPTLKGKKVLYVYGGWKGHEPTESVDVFVPWLKAEGAEVTVSNSLDSYLDKALMDSLDLVIQVWTMDKISKEQEKGLLDAIKSGIGMAGWHGGIGDTGSPQKDHRYRPGGQNFHQ